MSKHNFNFTWVMSHLCRGMGWLMLILGIYGLVPGAPFLPLIQGITRIGLSLYSIAAGVFVIMSAESWLVWFQTERNTQAIIEELERLNTTVEQLYRQTCDRSA